MPESLPLLRHHHPNVLGRSPSSSFHAINGEHEALIEIRSSEIIEGSLPLGARSLVSQWIDLHRTELIEQWEFGSAVYASWQD
jgi:uncharacterized protein DUF4160